MLTNEELIAEYAYLDDLDCRGQAWELLRRNDSYRADYDRLQTFQHPDPFGSEHATLVKKWHVRHLIDPDSRKVPEFFHERWQNISSDLILRNSAKWKALSKEKEPPGFNRETFMHSIICKDLKDRGCSLNKIACRLYPGFEGRSHDTKHHPARQRVRDDLARYKKLQAGYLKIAFSDTYSEIFGLF